MFDNREPIPRKLLPFDLNRPRTLVHRRRWDFASKVKDGDIIDMNTGNILDIRGLKFMDGGKRVSDPSGPKYNFNRFDAQIPDPEG